MSLFYLPGHVVQMSDVRFVAVGATPERVVLVPLDGAPTVRQVPHESPVLQFAADQAVAFASDELRNHAHAQFERHGRAAVRDGVCSEGELEAARARLGIAPPPEPEPASGPVSSAPPPPLAPPALPEALERVLRLAARYLPGDHDGGLVEPLGRPLMAISAIGAELRRVRYYYEDDTRTAASIDAWLVTAGHLGALSDAEPVAVRKGAA